MKKNHIIFSVVVVSVIVGASITAIGYAKNDKEHQNSAPVCARATDNSIRCHAHVIVDKDGMPKTSALPSGYGPLQFLGAYNLSGTALTNQTIAIVDAYNDPSIKSDLDTYNATFGLPYFPNCSATVTTGCFQKVNQRGGINYPKTNAGWALEISLDVEVAHAVCQNCKILLVEADSSSYSNLMTAVDRARIMGANVISNSYGSNEFLGENAYDSHFNYKGVAFTFSSGDSGYAASYPAASPYVTSVGGTSLNLSGNSYLSESAWSGSGSGCSAYEAKPSFQSDLGCTNRTIADVSADADPNTGAAVYSSVRYYGQSGWFQVGGTSLSAPLVAAVYVLNGSANANTYANSLPYTNGSYLTNLHDITTGSNGSCSIPYLCSAQSGYDGPTGVGTPNGSSAF